jgi:acid phosphatase
MKRYIFIILIGFLYLINGCSKQSATQQKHPNHIVIVIEENKNFEQIIGNLDAPYINSLAKQGLLFTDAHGVWHPSQPNYIALFSGSRQGVKNDHCQKENTPFTTPNLGYELISHGYSFAGYSESMPKVGFTGCHAGKSSFQHGNTSSLYARKHNPWVNWQSDSTKYGLPDSVNKPFKDFPSDYSKLPDVAIVVPNEDNEMHNGPDSLTIARADQWLKKHLDGYIQWAKDHNSLFIFTFDEDDFRQINRIPMIFVGPMVKNGKDSSRVNHYNVLRTVEKLYDLPNAGPPLVKPIMDIWTWDNA